MKFENVACMEQKALKVSLVFSIYLIFNVDKCEIYKIKIGTCKFYTF